MDSTEHTCIYVRLLVKNEEIPYFESNKVGEKDFSGGSNCALVEVYFVNQKAMLT